MLLFDGDRLEKSNIWDLQSPKLRISDLPLPKVRHRRMKLQASKQTSPWAPYQLSSSYYTLPGHRTTHSPTESTFST